ncbi:UDP-3-O-acyl-N-acetylglucosamine deacetylase [Paracoccus litorisediminis]|uniref:UDP-3-O-acyl-N-acetylglucosamine deacetylase n=1 Tax=Paracoccus litorisediminis TaxID=2006130 RepID=UPI003733DD33
MQATIRSKTSFAGVGLHSGTPARLDIHPASPDHGIVFRRIDMMGKPRVPARWDHVVPSELCTRIEGTSGANVSTIEHVMAALSAAGITNALVEIDGPEVPILDGSAEPFLRGILLAGIERQDVPARAIRILRPIQVERGSSSASLVPSRHFELEFLIEFPDPAIGRQSFRLDPSNGAFGRELADCRTFCREADVLEMKRRGLAQGGTYTNAVVFDGDKVLSPGGLRRPNEPVRHKMLDAIGDLALAGMPIIGLYRGKRAGHALTNHLLRVLMADRSAWRIEEAVAMAA